MTSLRVTIESWGGGGNSGKWRGDDVLAPVHVLENAQGCMWGWLPPRETSGRRRQQNNNYYFFLIKRPIQIMVLGRFTMIIPNLT